MSHRFRAGQTLRLVSLYNAYTTCEMVKDPGRTMWNDQPGDYSGYNGRFGGLPAFRKAIRKYRHAGALVTLYTDPFRLNDNCPAGKAFGNLWGVIGADGKRTAAYEVRNPCHDNPDVRRWVARTEEGVSQWNKAVADAARQVRAAMDRIGPGLVLTTEYPGYDFLLQFLEGSITYDTTVQASPLRPLECNLQRFYFPECKPYELDYSPLSPVKKFWNAEGSFGNAYLAPMYVILKENEDTYQGRRLEPLVPTQARYIYANRFSPGPSPKTIYHFYNATGHTFEGPVPEIPLRPEEHLFDLLNLRECRLRAGAVRIFLPRDEVVCLARLPKRLSAARSGDRLQARLKSGEGLLAVCDPDGAALLSRKAKTGQNTMDLSRLSAGAKPACLKLLIGGQLADAAELPGLQH
ncbi:MAG: hypothetical protein IT210_19325 [Armatimonadetes bacterium]|nr:hypothetical protein [Armatimonadota bacterium]